MALFPASPTNGQQTTVNNITYTYDSTQTAWVRTSTGGNISAGNGTFSGNLAVGSNLTVAGTANITTGQLFSNNLLLQGDGTDGYIRPTNAGSKLFIGTNNNNYMQISAAGLVGIGTTPAAKLDVLGVIRATGTGSTYMQLASGDANGASLALIRGGNTSQAAYFGQYQGSLLIKNLDSGPIIYTTTTSDTERMRITNDGKVGIGTSTPASKIDVRSGDITVSRTAAGLAGDAALYFGNGNNNYIFGGDASNIMAFAVNGSERVRVDVNGNVGIGNTAPTDKLSVNGNVAANYYTGNGSQLTGIFAAAVTKTANYTAVAGDVLACNTITTGAFTITLPATPAAGQKPITIFDAGTTDTANGFAANNLTVARNGSTIHTLADDVLFSTKGVCVTFEYIDSTWRMRVGG